MSSTIRLPLVEYLDLFNSAKRVEEELIVQRAEYEALSNGVDVMRAERDALTKAAQELVKATRKRLTTAGYHAIELQVDALARLAFTPTEDES